MAKILILGGGFAAVAAAEGLVSAIGDQDELVVVSKSEEFIFYPGLVPLVFDKVKFKEISFDLSRAVGQRKIRLVKGEAIELDQKLRKVRLVNGPDEEILNFDYLLIAVGRKIQIETIPGFDEYSHHLLNVEAALLFKEAMAEFDSGSIVVGVCPGASLPIPMCEAALGLADRFRDQIIKRTVSIKLVFPSSMENALAGSGLFRDLESEFERKGIILVQDFPIAEVHKNAISSTFGRRIDHDLLLLMPAFVGQDLFVGKNSITDAEGFVKVDDKMQVVGSDRIYAAGDIISLPGPRFGYMALRQGKIAAENILARVRNSEPNAKYKHEIEWIIGERYTDPIFFHYGFWDETLEDFEEDALFGMAKLIRKHYGTVRDPPDNELSLATGA